MHHLHQGLRTISQWQVTFRGTTMKIKQNGASSSQTTAPSSSTQPISASPGRTYVAKGGETLQGIAHAAYGDESLASSLATALNRHPTRSLRKGAKLELPDANVLIPPASGESLDVSPRSAQARRLAGSDASRDPLSRGGAGLSQPGANAQKTVLNNVADTLRSTRLQNALGGYDLSEIADTLETDPAAAAKHAVGQAMVWTAFAEEGEEAAVLEAANDLRGIAKTVIQASELPKNEQADVIRHSIAEGRALLTYVVGGKSLPKLMRKAGLPPLSRELQAAIILSADLHIPTTLTGPAAFALGAMSAEQRFEKLKLVDDQQFENIVFTVDETIKATSFGDSPEVKSMMDPKKGFDFSKVPPSFSEFLKLILTSYFDNLGHETKRAILLELLSLPADATTAQKLGSIVNQAGPGLQKAFQLVGDEVDAPELKEVMIALKDQIKPFPTAKARKIIERSLGKPVDQLFSHFPDKPIAAASVGQVYIAEVGVGDEKRKVIVKVMRPGIRDRAEEEMEVLRTLANGKGNILKLIDKMEESLFAELDFVTELNNLREGHQVYGQPLKGLNAVGIGPNNLNGTSDVLVMEIAPGQALDKLPQHLQLMKMRALESLTKHWFNEALFGGGFFHGDLHAGNIFLKPLTKSERTITTTETYEYEHFEMFIGVPPYDDGEEYDTYHYLEEPYELTLIDFGATATLSKLQQHAILRMVVGLDGGWPELVMKSMHDFAPDMTPEQVEQLEIFVQATIDMKIDPGRGTGEILNFAALNEIELPTAFLAFHRGLAFLQKQMDDSAEAYKAANPDSKAVVPDFGKAAEAVVKAHKIELAKAWLGW